MIIKDVPQDMLESLWPFIAPFLSKAVNLTPEMATLNDVYEQCANGENIAWVVVQDNKIIAAYTTRVVEYPQARALIVDYLGGERMKDWLGLAVTSIKNQAKRNNCKWFEAYGRRGWERLVKEYNVTQSHVVYKMEL